MNILKKISKRKNILKNSHLIVPTATEDVDPVKGISILEPIYLSGKFQFLVINGFAELQGFDLLSNKIHSFDSEHPIRITGKAADFNLEDCLNNINEDLIYNHLLKNSYQTPSIIILGEFQLNSTGLSECELENTNKSTMFIGDKGCGKSTTLSLTSNYLLNHSKVFILDCDLGQSIVLPGFVNLIELRMPLFLDKPTIIYQGFVGEFTTQNYIELFFSIVVEAMNAYNACQLIRDYPLLINTAGFISNYGIPILQEMINIVKPQQVVTLSPSSKTQKMQQVIDKLKQKSFFNITTKIIPVYKLVILDFDITDVSKGQNPQARKSSRYAKVQSALGLSNLEYLTLCSATEQVIRLEDCSFQDHQQKQVFQDPTEIARIYALSLVCLLNKNEVQIGYVKDIDILNGNMHIIAKNDILPLTVVLKSKHFDIARVILLFMKEMYGNISESNIQDFLDEQSILNGESIQNITYPFLQEKSRAIGDVVHKIKINKKAF